MFIFTVSELTWQGKLPDDVFECSVSAHSCFSLISSPRSLSPSLSPLSSPLLLIDVLEMTIGFYEILVLVFRSLIVAFNGLYEEREQYLREQ